MDSMYYNLGLYICYGAWVPLFICALLIMVYGNINIKFKREGRINDKRYI
jgi:hypothetical protein